MLHITHKLNVTLLDGPHRVLRNARNSEKYSQNGIINHSNAK